jgi:hypothetical protein
MLPPISNADNTAAISPVLPISSAPEASAAEAVAANVQPLAATVEFSDLGQFLSTVALSRRQLLELQGARDEALPGEAQLALLNDAAEAIRQSFNQLPPVSSSLTPLLEDEKGASTLAQRLADSLRQQGAAARPTTSFSATTLASIGVTLDPLAPESISESLNVNKQVLEAAFQLDRNGTLKLLTQTSEQFNTVGATLARQITAAAQAAQQAAQATQSAQAALATSASATLQAETAFSQLQINDQALRDAISVSAPALTPAEQLRQQQLEVARRVIAEQAGNVLAETQADRLAANHAAEARQLASTREQDQAASALADRMEDERLAAQRQDAATARAILADRLDTQRVPAREQPAQSEEIGAIQAAEARAAELRSAQAAAEQRAVEQRAAARQAESQRIAERDEAQRLADAREASGNPVPNAADPALAAAIAAYNSANIAAAAGARAPIPAPAADRVRPAAPVTAVAPVQPADSGGGDTTRTTR